LVVEVWEQMVIKSQKKSRKRLGTYIHFLSKFTLRRLYERARKTREVSLFFYYFNNPFHTQNPFIIIIIIIIVIIIIIIIL
jgi:hypothetical protein